MKFTLPVITFALTSLLPSALAVLPQHHAAALRVLRRTVESSALQRRGNATPQGLLKRQLDECTDKGYVLCPTSEFCCPAGLTCVLGGWCADEELTSCYKGEEDCGTHCCQSGFECIPNSDKCKPIGGSSTSSSSSNGVDTTRKQKSEAGEASRSTDNIVEQRKSEAGRSTGSVVLAGAGVLAVILVL